MSRSQDVSVIIPVYNGAQYLEAAVNSVHQQNGFNSRVIVVDDGSTDDTPLVCRALDAKIHYVRQDNQGPAAARNFGLSLAESDFISFLDADDKWPKQRLQLLFTKLHESTELDMVLGMTQMFAGTQFLESHHHWLLGAGLYRRRAFEKVGELAPELRTGEDLDWFLRARRKGATISLVPETTLYLRREKQNMTHNKTLQELNFHRVIKRHIDSRKS